MSFLAFPIDLLLQISDHLDRQYDFNALTLVCRHFHYNFNDQLYLFNIKYRQSRGLFWAAEEGRIFAVRRFLSLLGPDAEIDAKIDSEYTFNPCYLFTYPRRYKTCLHLAISNSHFEIVQLLLDNGADPLRRNAKGQTPLYLGLVSGHDGIIKLISSYIEDLPNHLVDSEKRYTPLHIASRHGLSNWVRYFLEQGADVNAKDKRNWTALRHAIATDFMAWPLGSSVDINRSMKPSSIQIFETVRVLVNFSANPNPEFTVDGRGEREDDPRTVTAAFVGARHMDPKVRALFGLEGGIAGGASLTEKEVADMVRFSPYELR
jgi:ankyrin repeat protein